MALSNPPPGTPWAAGPMGLSGIEATPRPSSASDLPSSSALEEQETAVTLETNPATVPDADVLEETRKTIQEMGLVVELAWFDSASRQGFLAVRGPLAIVAEAVRRSEFAQPPGAADAPAPEVVVEVAGPRVVPLEHKILDADLGLALGEGEAVLRARVVTDPRVVDSREKFNDFMGRASAVLDLGGGFHFDPSSRFGRVIVAGMPAAVSSVVAWPEVAVATVSTAKEKTLRRLVDVALWERLRAEVDTGLTLSFSSTTVPDASALQALVDWLRGVNVTVEASIFKPEMAASHLRVRGPGIDLLLAIVDLGDRLSMVTSEDFLRHGASRLDDAIAALEEDMATRMQPVRATIYTDDKRVRSPASFKKFTGLLEKLGIHQTGCAYAPGSFEGRITAYATPASLKKLAAMPQIKSIVRAQGRG